MTLSEQERAAAAQALAEATRFVVRQMAALEGGGFSALAALSMLDSSGPSRITELAVREGISQPSMTTMVTRLERRGYVERRRDPSDGRIVLVAITPAGRGVLRRRRAAQVAFLSNLIGAMDPAEQRALAGAATALQHMTDPDLAARALAAAKQVGREHGRSPGHDHESGHDHDHEFDHNHDDDHDDGSGSGRGSGHDDENGAEHG